MDNNTTTVVDAYQQTFNISLNEAYVNGHTSWGGEVFYVFVPPKDRGQGVAKMLLRKAIRLLKEDFHCTSPGITSATSPEGVGLVEWFKREVQNE